MVKAITFGGSRNNDLYITTALKGLKKDDIKKYHLSGSLFKIKTNTKGMLSKPFGILKQLLIKLNFFNFMIVI